MITAVRARWALIEPSRIGLASSAGLPDADDRLLSALAQRSRWIREPSALIIGLIGLDWPTFFRAHRANCTAVLEAYGFPKDASESDIVARLFKMY